MNMRMMMSGLLLAGLAMGLAGSAPAGEPGDPTGIVGKVPPPQLLFDGKTFAGWTTRDGQPVKRGWVVEDGCIYRKEGGGDIYTEKEYGDFILLFDWKVAEGSNSGVKYRCDKQQMIGPEYQILDDAHHRNGLKAKTSACSLYDIKAPAPDKPLLPVGQWNRGKIVAIGTHYEHWVNGVKVLEIDTASDEWRQLKANSKYRNNKTWGISPTGRIMLQDHGNPVWYRNLVIIDLSQKR